MHCKTTLWFKKIPVIKTQNTLKKHKKLENLILIKYKHSWQGKVTLDNWTITFNKARTQSTSLHERQGLNELGMICAIKEEWAKPTRQPRGLIPIRRNHSRKVQTMVLK
jgi:nitrogen fixation protein